MSMSDLPHTSFWWYNTLQAPSRYPCYHLYISLTSHIFLVILLAPSSLQISLLSCLCQIYLTHLSSDITRSQLPPDILATISMSALPHTLFWWYNTLPTPSRYPCYHLYVRSLSHTFFWWYYSLPAPSRYPCYHLYVSLTSHIFLVTITRSQLPPDILATISMSDLPHTSFWWYYSLPAPSRYPCYHLYVRFTSHIFLVI